MLYTLEKRYELGRGITEAHWEVWSYTHVSPIGVLMNGKAVKRGTKEQCERFCRRKNIDLVEH